MSGCPVTKARVTHTAAQGPGGRRCANLRCIEAGFVDVRRLTYHGHDSIKCKTLSLLALKEKGEQIKFFSSTSSAVSRLHQSKRETGTQENNANTLQRNGKSLCSACSSKYKRCNLQALTMSQTKHNDSVFVGLDSAHLSTDQWRP